MQSLVQAARRRRFLPHPARLLVTACIVTACTGCGPTAPDAVPVSGVVRHRGRPLADATVVFVAEDRGPGGGLQVATGITDAAGRFALVSRLGRAGVAAGAVPGSHRVTVSAFVPPAGITEAEFQRRVDAHHAAEERKGFGTGGDLPQRVPLLEAACSDPAATRLSAEVTREGPNEFIFDVE